LQEETRSPDRELVEQHAEQRMVLVITDALRHEVDVPERVRRYQRGEIRGLTIDLGPEFRGGDLILRLQCGRVLKEGRPNDRLTAV